MRVIARRCHWRVTWLRIRVLLQLYPGSEGSRAATIRMPLTPSGAATAPGRADAALETTLSRQLHRGRASTGAKRRPNRRPACWEPTREPRYRAAAVPFDVKLPDQEVNQRMPRAEKLQRIVLHCHIVLKRSGNQLASRIRQAFFGAAIPLRINHYFDLIPRPTFDPEAESLCPRKQNVAAAP